MTKDRFFQLTEKYPRLRIAVVGDFCLDRYLEIDPSKQETSLETGLPVHNVVNVRSQPGGAGTIVNNLSALGVGAIYPVGFCGVDAEGFELKRALSGLQGVRCEYLLQTDQRRTFTYCKPLVVAPGKAPVELNRLDTKNWTATPTQVREKILDAVAKLQTEVDGFIILDQVDLPETGVVCGEILRKFAEVIKTHPQLPILGDSRRRLKDFPSCGFKVNRKEFCAMSGLKSDATLNQIKERAIAVATQQRRNVFITLSEDGILGVFPDGSIEHALAHAVHGEIDVVGAGDAVAANLVTSLAAHANLRESLEIANAAASIVVHQLGTTGTASTAQIARLLLQ